ncbi:MAG: hypothetical protein E7K72_24450 [Roseomonas mucosa]|nr:hypothetical protein [Roseomonas mucosa]
MSATMVPPSLQELRYRHAALLKHLALLEGYDGNDGVVTVMLGAPPVSIKLPAVSVRVQIERELRSVEQLVSAIGARL